MKTLIRMATTDDAEQILAIYAPIVNETVISFEFDPPSIDEMRRRISQTLTELPWVVCEREGRIIGYAYAARYRARLAYQWSVEVSVYVGDNARRQGVARAVYTSLFEILTLQGFVNMLAGITLPNQASVTLHESLGFHSLGTYESVGHKFGYWHDVGWWQRRLQPLPHLPDPPTRLPDVGDSTAFETALASGLAWLQEQ